MFVRSLAVFALVLAPVAVRSADEDNPLKAAKVGDFATYKMTFKRGDMDFKGTLTHSVTEKSDKEATVSVSGSIEINDNKKDFPAREQKIDLTKPFDPTKASFFGGRGEATYEKLKEGKEKIKVNGKEYDSTWTTYKVKTKIKDQDIESEVKVWLAKSVPTGLVKMTTSGELAGRRRRLR